MTTTAETKTCRRCGATFTRRRGEGAPRWESRRYCGKVCSVTVARTAPKPIPVVQPTTGVWRPPGWSQVPDTRPPAMR